MKRKYILVAISAFLSSLPFSFPSLFFLTLLCPSVFFYYLMTQTDSKVCTKISFLWANVYYLGVHYYFTALYPLDFAGLSNAASIAVVLIGWVGIALFQGCELSLMMLLSKKLFSQNNLLSPLIFGVFFSLCEWIQSLGWVGFPWGGLSLTQYKFLPFIQSLSLFGPYFITFLIVVINAYIAQFFIYKKKSFLVVASAIFLVNTLFGAVRLYVPSNARATVTAAIVQPSLMSGEKWDTSRGTSSFDIHMELSEEVKDSDLILWPETAVPSNLLENSIRMQRLEKFADDNSSELIVGTFYNDEYGEYNVAALVGGKEEQVYKKQHLVPFGEYVPMRGFIEKVLPFLTEINMLSSDLSAGELSTLFDTKQGKVGTLVCFDSIFTSLARKSARCGATLLTVITNDSWYKDSVALYHHNAQSVFRAVENNRYVVRCANSGVSSFIDSRGRILKITEPYEICAEKENVNLISEKTLYTLTGNIFTPLSVLFIALGFVLQRKKH